ncbi:MAG: hypothetical protein IPM25_07205, partial [Chloracidobacterium sp.]|nr:hypothetical protein [Chloracidobacterium sp.]
EGLAHIDEIAANYTEDIGTSAESLKRYLKENIIYAPRRVDALRYGAFFELAFKNGLTIGTARQA